MPYSRITTFSTTSLSAKGVERKQIETRVKRALKMVGMTDYEHRDVDSLSGGQQQRVAIARAIVNRPQVLLLDEPLAALDLKMRKDMQMELKEMHRSLGITFVYVTHDQEEALTLSDTIVVMSEGRIQQIGTPMDIYNEPCNSFVADFIGESNILNAVMVRDRLVRFMGKEFECVDTGFGEDVPVDVVIRPEDVYIIAQRSSAMFTGTVRSCTFKGVHYEMFVDTPDGYEIMIQDYNRFEVGTEVGMIVKPSDIHVMRKERVCNTLEGVMKDATHVEMLGGVFECTPAEGVEAGEKVRVEVDFGDVELTDDSSDGTVGGTIRFILYKGDRFHLTVRTEEGINIYADTHDVWEDLDEVGIKIRPQSLRISRMHGKTFSPLRQEEQLGVALCRVSRDLRGAAAASDRALRLSGCRGQLHAGKFRAFLQPARGNTHVRILGGYSVRHHGDMSAAGLSGGLHH